MPSNAVVVVLQADLTFPLVYAQVVNGRRHDVNIVTATSLQFGWYREQLTCELHLARPLASAPYDRQTLSLIAVLRSTRPVYIDMSMIQFFREKLGYQPTGLVAKVVDRIGATPVGDAKALARTLVDTDRADGIARHG